MTLEEAFHKWADELTGYATAITGRADAADVVADTFAGLLMRCDRYDSSRNGAVEPRAYLFRSVLNTARMRARSSDRRRARELTVSAWGASQTSSVDGLLADPAVRVAVDRLSEQQRAVTYLTYWDDMTPQQIAETLDVGLGTVKRHLARARAQLRKVLTP